MDASTKDAAGSGQLLTTCYLCDLHFTTEVVSTISCFYLKKSVSCECKRIRYITIFWELYSF